MQLLKSNKIWLTIVLIAAISVTLAVRNHSESPVVTTQTEIGTVTSFISVSGNANIEEVIPLSFPRGGTVSGVFVTRGDTVATGTVLAIVGDTNLQAEYAAAAAEVDRVRAIRDKLLNGKTAQESAVTETTVKNAEAALINTIRTEGARVEGARTTLYSTDVTAVATDPDTEGLPPTVTGSYVCTAEGTYTLELYRSNAESGYSYRYSGIETGTGNASTNQPSPLGSCGLRLQFSADARYRTGTIFTISIPNTASTKYASNRALYDQARAQEEANIQATRRTLDLALDQASVATAGARVEELIAANAVVAAAEARLTQASFALRDSAIRAPRTGIITDISTVAGQTVATQPVVTLYAPTKTTFTARIPEKDITEVTAGLTAHITFDAMPDQSISAIVDFISPLQNITNGAPFYEAELTLTETPLWLRSGMQADVKIITHAVTDAVRIPRVYLDGTHIYLRTETGKATSTPDILLIGTDGFVALEGIATGTELVLPTN